MSEKKPRGRPAKKINITNIPSEPTLNTNDNNDLIITDTIIRVTPSSEIQKVGRPKKYSDEERQQKYKEANKKWIEDNKEYFKNQCKTYYEENRDIIDTQKKNYQHKTREAFRILKEIWTSQDCIISENIKSKVELLFEKNKSIMI